FFQAEDGIRDFHVTGVQTCALPIWEVHRRNMIVDEWDGPLEDAPVGPRIVVVFEEMNATMATLKSLDKRLHEGDYTAIQGFMDRSEERRVGKEWRWR